MGQKTKTPVDGSKKQDEELNEMENLNLSDEDLDEPKEAPLNPREAAIKLIVKDVNDERDQAHIDEGLEPTGGVKVKELVLPDELKALEDDFELIDPDLEIVDKLVDSGNNQIISRDGKQFLKIRVDGKDKEVPLDDAITYLQKNENADEKLGQANLLLNQARTIQQSQASTPPDDSTDPVVDKTAVNAVFNKLYDGDVDEAASDFTKLLSKQTAPKVDISAQVAQEVARVTDHSNLVSSFNRFAEKDEFKHLVNDPTLKGKVNDFTVELQQDQEFMAKNPKYEDIFDEAGRRTIVWLETIAPTSSTDDIIESQRNRKRNKAKVVNSRTARRGPKPEEKVATREDIIAKIAVARHQNI